MSAPGVAGVNPRAASLIAAAAELIGPLSGAATPQQLPWSGVAQFDSGGLGYRSLLLVRLLADLADESVTATVTIGGIGQAPVRFDAWSERGSQLVGFIAATDADGVSAAFAGSIAVARNIAGTVTDIAAADVASLVAVDLVQGQLGRLLAVLLAEDQRLRRQAREITSMRRIATARLNALDRAGADVGAPRLSDELSWDVGIGKLGTTPLPGNREQDEHYRRRLRVLRATRLPTPGWIDASVNGPGAAGDPGAGWLADAGITTRVGVDEEPNQLLIGFRLVCPGRPHARTELLAAIRQAHLVWPAGSAAGDAAHASRWVSPAATAEVAATRAALENVNLPAGEPVAPALAAALRTLDDLQTRLGSRPYGSVLGGQRDDGGSRFELGLGARLARPSGADISASVTAAQALADPALVPVPAADDPIAAWLLHAAGLRTAELLTDGTVYVSATSTGRLMLDVTPSAEGASPLTLAARLEAVGSTVFDAPMATVVAAMSASGGNPVADPAALIAGIQPTSAVPALATALAELGLPAVVEVADLQTRLSALPPRDHAILDLGATVTNQIEGDPESLTTLLRQAQTAGASSALPLVTSAGTLALVLGVTDLPLAGNNLASAHTIAFRWQVRGLADDVATLSPRRGPTATLTTSEPNNTGLSLVTCLAYVRDGHNDPYEWRPTLPDGALLTLDQYEHLMNVIELVTPLGVQANTWAVRRRHVDVDGSGSPTPLSPDAASTFHRYRPMHP